ncbi:class I SAM-dependent methyltransferase [Streptosporangiaceae bacterium NEAU-GS5]|nr:class I SAM-dependent methyltransferase [Streptosporangiaceae bacterium NEAU-GS5]
MSQVLDSIADGVFTHRIREQWTEQLGRRLDILIAGCGRETVIFEDRLDSRVVGIDEDRPPLRVHTASRADLAAWHLGDLRAVPLPPRAYDVVQAPFLLERIEHAELVLDRLVAALRPGGLLLVRLRDRASAYGFCVRMTPSWARRALWKGFVRAGTVGPLPAVYEEVSSREGLHAYCLMRGLMVAEEYPATSGDARIGPRASLTGMVCRLVDRLSGGRLPSDHDEIAFVIRKPQNHFARLI